MKKSGKPSRGRPRFETIELIFHTPLGRCVMLSVSDPGHLDARTRVKLEGGEKHRHRIIVLARLFFTSLTGFSNRGVMTSSGKPLVSGTKSR